MTKLATRLGSALGLKRRRLQWLRSQKKENIVLSTVLEQGLCLPQGVIGAYHLLSLLIKLLSSAGQLPRAVNSAYRAL